MGEGLIQRPSAWSQRGNVRKEEAVKMGKSLRLYNAVYEGGFKTILIQDVVYRPYMEQPFHLLNHLMSVKTDSIHFVPCYLKPFY